MRTKRDPLTDAVDGRGRRAAELKWELVGHVARQAQKRWAVTIS